MCIERLCEDFFPDGVPDLRAGQFPYSSELPQIVLDSIGRAEPCLTSEHHSRQFRSMVGSIIIVPLALDLILRTRLLETRSAVLEAADRALAYLHEHPAPLDSLMPPIVMISSPIRTRIGWFDALLLRDGWSCL